MSSVAQYVVCPKCGTDNPATARYCAACGNQLTGLASGPSASPSTPSMPATSPASPFYGFTTAYYVTERAREIDRTKTGLLVISVGFFVSWVPILGMIGNLFQLVGAILVILGRDAFGPVHARNVIWSIVTFVIAIVAGIAVGVVLVFSALANYQYSPGSAPLSFSSLMGGGYYAGIIVGVAIFGVAEVLFTYALQEKTGRILLWCGYGGTTAASSVSFFLLNNISYVNSLLYLGPSILYGYAYYMARQRIVRGEIPTSLQPPS